MQSSIPHYPLLTSRLPPTRTRAPARPSPRTAQSSVEPTSHTLRIATTDRHRDIPTARPRARSQAGGFCAWRRRAQAAGWWSRPQPLRDSIRSCLSQLLDRDLRHLKRRRELLDLRSRPRQLNHLATELRRIPTWHQKQSSLPKDFSIPTPLSQGQIIGIQDSRGGSRRGRRRIRIRLLLHRIRLLVRLLAWLRRLWRLTHVSSVRHHATAAAETHAKPPIQRPTASR